MKYSTNSKRMYFEQPYGNKSNKTDKWTTFLKDINYQGFLKKKIDNLNCSISVTGRKQERDIKEEGNFRG